MERDPLALLPHRRLSATTNPERATTGGQLLRADFCRGRASVPSRSATTADDLKSIILHPSSFLLEGLQIVTYVGKAAAHMVYFVCVKTRGHDPLKGIAVAA